MHSNMLNNFRVMGPWAQRFPPPPGRDPRILPKRKQNRPKRAKNRTEKTDDDKLVWVKRVPHHIYCC